VKNTALCSMVTILCILEMKVLTKREVQMPKKLVISLSVQLYHSPSYFITFTRFDSRLGHLREL
jgi:hypothetical protein